MKKINSKNVKSFVMIFVALFVFLCNSIKVSAATCKWRFFSPMIDNTSLEIIDDKGLKIIKKEFEGGDISGYDVYDAPNHEYAELIMTNNNNPFSHFGNDFNGGDYCDMSFEHDNGYKAIVDAHDKLGYCPSITVRFGYKETASNIIDADSGNTHAALIDGIDEDTLIKYISTGHDFPVHLVYCEPSKSKKVNDCWLGAYVNPGIASDGTLFVYPFFSEYDLKEVPIDEQIDKNLSSKGSSFNLYQKLMDFSSSSKGTFRGGAKPSKAYGEYIVYKSARDAWSKKIDQVLNESTKEQERVRSVFSLWWNHAKYYSMAEFFTKDNEKNHYSSITSKMKLVNDGEKEDYVFEGNLEEYEFFKFSKFYYENNEDYIDKIESPTIEYLKNMLDSGTRSNIDDRFRIADITSHLKKLRKDFIRPMAVTGSAIYEACGNPPFMGWATINGCADKIDKDIEDNNKDTCIKPAVDRYNEALNLTVGNNSISNNSTTAYGNDTFYTATVKTAEDDYKSCLGELLKTLYPGVTDEQIKNSDSHVQSMEDYATAVYDDYNSSLVRQREREATMAVEFAIDDIEMNDVDLEVDCEKLESFRWGWNIIIYSAPFLLILFGSIDYFKVITAGDPDAIKKSKKNFRIRLIAFVLLLILPVIIRALIGFFKDSSRFIQTMDCIVNGK